MNDDILPPRRTSCPRCYQDLRPVVRWQGQTPVSVGWACPTTLCGYRVLRRPWFVGVA
jgi:ssDNA-binding Zn-finger/Zn-ribbon topoisomerase 1